MDEVVIDDRGGAIFVCSDTDHCERAREAAAAAVPGAAGGEA